MTALQAVPHEMKVAVVTGYGGPETVQIETRPVPVIKPDAVLIEVVSTTVNSGDVRMRALDAPKGMKTLMRLAIGLGKPRQPIFGTEVSGIVAAMGANVEGFSVGDPVIAFPGIALGCHAEYVAVSTGKPLVHKPDALSFEEAAGLAFGGTTALHFLRKAGVTPGEDVLVIGASGAVGAAMVQLAAHFGALVTAVTSAGNADLVRALGAQAVIDYATTDYTAVVAAYDVIADCVGASSFEDCLAALRPGGRYLAIAGGIGEMIARGRNGKQIIAGMAQERSEDLALLARLAAEGRYRVVVDQVFAFDDIAKAHARVDSKRKRGSVVVRITR